MRVSISTYEYKPCRNYSAIWGSEYTDRFLSLCVLVHCCVKNGCELLTQGQQVKDFKGRFLSGNRLVI